MTPQAYRARVDRRSHLMKIAGLEALVVITYGINAVGSRRTG